MRLVLIISLMFFTYGCGGDSRKSDSESVVVSPVACPEFDENEIKDLVYDFNKALVAKDTAKLNELLHDELSYGHSNSWVENKKELKADLFNNMLTYHSVEQPELSVIYAGDVVTVRGNGIFDVDYKSTEHMIFDLHVMQTWIYEDGRWQMLNRQSMANKK